MNIRNRNRNLIICSFISAGPSLVNKNIFTSLGVFPGGLALLEYNFFFYFRFFVELIEVIDDDGDWKCNAEDSTESTAYHEMCVGWCGRWGAQHGDNMVMTRSVPGYIVITTHFHNINQIEG